MQNLIKWRWEGKSVTDRSAGVGQPLSCVDILGRAGLRAGLLDPPSCALLPELLGRQHGLRGPLRVDGWMRL